jgi:hypothetical protein
LFSSEAFCILYTKNVIFKPIKFEKCFVPFSSGFFISLLLPENVMNKTKTTNSAALPCGCETWSVTLAEEPETEGV